MSEETILPCPFCGGQDIEVQVEKGCGKYQLWCNDCFCAGPLHLFRPSSIKYWNIRNSQKLGNPKNSAEKEEAVSPKGETNTPKSTICPYGKCDGSGVLDNGYEPTGSCKCQGSGKQ